MASTDARPVPRKNVAFRVTFPLLDADGDLVVGATGLDSEVSKDGGTFTDCTSEATQIATSSGVYFLDLSATEMNADTVAVIVKSTTAKTMTLVMYPEESGDYRADVTFWNGTAVAAPATAGYPAVTLKSGTGTGELNLSSGSVPVSSIATDAITSTALAASAVSEIATAVNAEVVDALATDTYAEPAQGAPAATASLATKIGYLYKFLRNKRTQTATTFSLFNDDASTVDHKATVSDDGTVFTQNELTTGP